MTMDRYWAFISYSHADEAMARWLHRALETYRVPRKLVGQPAPEGMVVPPRLFPVFRDRDDLASAGSLSGKINDALVRAEALIVIASRASAASHWVNEEIRCFKALGKSRRVFCVIVDGEPCASSAGQPQDECFAPALRFEVGDDGQLTEQPAEPVAADIRRGKDSRHDALLKLVAGVLDLGLDALKQRDLLRRQHRLTAIAASALVAAAFTTGLAYFAVEARNDAQAQRSLAETRRSQAEGLIQFMLGDLRKKLEPIGKLDILDAVGEQAMNYFAEVDAVHLSDAELSARAQALRQIGDVRVQQGKLNEASPAFHESLKLDEERVRRNPEDQQAIFNMAQSQFYIGYDHFLRADPQRALAWFERYDRSADRLLALDAQNLDWQREKQYALDNLATIQLALTDYDGCLASANAGIALVEALLGRHPEDADLNVTLASGLTKAALCHWYLGDLAAEVPMLERVKRILQSLREGAPTHSDYAKKAALNCMALGSALMEQGLLARARAEADCAVTEMKALVLQDPENIQWRSILYGAQLAVAELEVVEGRLDVGFMATERARETLSVLRHGAYETRDTHLDAVRFGALRLAIVQARRDPGAEHAAALWLAELYARSTPPTANAEIHALDAIACALLGRTRIAELKLPSFCLAAAQLPISRDSGRRAWVAEALRARVAGAADTQADAEAALREIGYHGAFWHLMQQ